MEFTITASIVAYKENEDTLRKAIESFLTTKLPVKLFLIDNSPTNTLNKLSAEYNIEYIFGHGNIGYGAAHNIVLKKSSMLGRYHLVLNPDVYFNSDVLVSLVKYMEENNDTGLITPKIYYPNGDLQFLCKLLPRPVDWIGRLIIPVKRIKDRINNRLELRFSGYNKIMNVPYISGCFMLFRSSVLKEIGVFDEGIFMYGEDTDITRRIHVRYRTLFYPYVHIYHEFHKASYRNLRLFIIHIKAAIYYFNKWGWLNDKERKLINNKVLTELGSMDGNNFISSKE